MTYARGCLHVDDISFRSVTDFPEEKAGTPPAAEKTDVILFLEVKER